MKTLFAFGTSALGLPIVLAGLVSAMPAAAQYGMRVGALGGSIGARPISRPLGGFAPGFAGIGAGRNFRSPTRGPLYGYPFAYSVWVPDYFDSLAYQNQYAAPYGTPDAYPYYGPPPAVAASPQQPVIINQYFGSPGPQTANAPEASSNPLNGPLNGPLNNDSSAQTPGAPIGSQQNYYLIAYKNHAVYSALAYWVEDKTLHYVTTQNTHNQASLDLIDLTLTKSLNQHNDVPFSIPGT
jgi:hypothetical protein